MVTLRSYGYHHLYLFCFGGLVIFKKILQALFVNVNLLICDCLSWQVTLRLTAHGFKFFYMFPGPYPACQWHQQLCIPACCILLPWLCNCSFWDFAATKVRLGMECLKLSSIGAVIVDHLDQWAGVQSRRETAMTTGLRFLPGPRADSWRSSDPGKQWTLWR